MQDCVFVKKKPARGYDFESIPRARRNATTHPSFATRNPPSLAREGLGVKLCASGGRVYCDGVTFEGEDALRAAFEHIGILAFLRCGKVLSCK